MAAALPPELVGARVGARTELGMTYGVIFDVPAPVAMYDALHAELLRSIEGPVEGLLAHVGRATAQGFQVVEVWESKDQFEHYNREVVGPAVQRLGGGAGQPPEPAVEEFEVRGLVVPTGGIAR